MLIESKDICLASSSSSISLSSRTASFKGQLHDDISDGTVSSRAAGSIDAPSSSFIMATRANKERNKRKEETREEMDFCENHTCQTVREFPTALSDGATVIRKASLSEGVNNEIVQQPS